MYARKIAHYENIIRDNYLCGLMSHSLTDDAKTRLHVLKKLKKKSHKGTDINGKKIKKKG